MIGVLKLPNFLKVSLLFIVATMLGFSFLYFTAGYSIWLAIIPLFIGGVSLAAVKEVGEADGSLASPSLIAVCAGLLIGPALLFIVLAMFAVLFGAP